MAWCYWSEVLFMIFQCYKCIVFCNKLNTIDIFTISFASRLIASSSHGGAFLQVFVTLFLNRFLYSLGVSLYIFVVLSAGIKTFNEDLILLMSCFISFRNLSFLFLNLTGFTSSSKSFSNISSSFIWDRYCFDLKPYFSLFVSVESSFMKKWAFQRMRLITFSILPIIFKWYDDFDGTGIYFNKQLKFIFSMLYLQKGALLNKSQEQNINNRLFI